MIYYQKIDMLSFTVYLTETALYLIRINAFGGNIISDNNGITIEIIDGVQGAVSHSDRSFFHGKVNNLGRLEFFEEKVPAEILNASKKAIRYLKLERGSFMQGYFEFIVSDKNEVLFLDYKTSFLKR